MGDKIIYKEKEYNCPLELAMDIVGGKWKNLIVYYLKDGAQRSGKLQKMIPHITNKMYTQSLRELESCDVIKRVVYPIVPPHVEYSLTERGELLIPILKQLVSWGYTFTDKVE